MALRALEDRFSALKRGKNRAFLRLGPFEAFAALVSLRTNYKKPMNSAAVGGGWV
jgi:hypothetical protein